MSANARRSSWPGATGNANANNEDELAANAGGLGTLIASVQAPGTPVIERCRNFRIISELLDVEKTPPIREAVDAGLIPALNSLLIKTPSDWTFESLRGVTALSSDVDTGNSNKLTTVSIWLPPLLELIDDTKVQAVEATKILLDCGFRDQAVNQALLETLSKIQYQGSSRELWNHTMNAVADFLFRKDLPLLDIDSARPGIEFLVGSMRSNDLNLDQDGGGAYHAIYSLCMIAERADPEYVQEMMNVGIVDVLIDLMWDLMRQNKKDLRLWELLVESISFLIVHGHDQAFLDAGIVDISMRFLSDRRHDGEGTAFHLWVVGTIWIAHFMLHSRVDESSLHFISAGVEEVLPRLLQGDDALVRLNGCKILLAISQSQGSSLIMMPFLENGSIQRVFESASTHDSSPELRWYAITVLALFCLAESERVVQKMIFKGYHGPVVDALDRGFFDGEERFGTPECWTLAFDRLEEMIWAKCSLGSLLISRIHQE